jgi:hypothetical protein
MQEDIVKFVLYCTVHSVDLYFLMDLSWSMRTSRDSLALLGEQIISAMNMKTSALTTGTHRIRLAHLPKVLTSALTASTRL